MFINVSTTHKRALKKYLRASSRPRLECYAPPVMLFEDCSAVAWSLPNGLTLDSIAFCLNRVEFAQFLSDHGLRFINFESLPQLVRYVPRKRALFRFAPKRAIYIKLYAPGEDEPAALNLALLNEAEDSLRLRFQAPRLLCHDPLRRALVMSEVAGKQLTESADSTAIFAVGRALATLHESGIKAVSSWNVEREASALVKAMADVKKALPALAESFDALLERIEQHRRTLDFNEVAPIHANLFGDQILVDSGRVAIVDWDDLAMGDPLFDVGRLAAHFIYLSLTGSGELGNTTRLLEILMRAYEQERGQAIVRERLRWHIAMALLMRAKISALRALADGWTGHVTAALEESRRLLEYRSECLP